MDIEEMVGNTIGSSEPQNAGEQNTQLAEAPQPKNVSREQRRQEAERLSKELQEDQDPKPREDIGEEKDDLDDTDEPDDDANDGEPRKKSAAVPYSRFKKVNEFATEAQKFATAALQRAERAEQELERLRAGSAPAAHAPAAPVEDAPPNMEDYATQGEYMKALNEHNNKLIDKRVNDIVTGKLTEQTQQTHQQQIVQKTMEVFNERVEAAAATNPQVREAVQYIDQLADDPRFPQHISKMLVESKLGPDVCHVLHKNPELLRNIILADAVTGIGQIARIEAALEQHKKTPRVEADPRRNDPPVPRKLPNPGRTSKDPSEMSRSEFREWARAQEKKGRR